MTCLDGHLLVASPHMEDANFARSVVLIIQHSEEGAFGVVLNRTSKHSIREVWERVGEGPCDVDGALRLGGPVEGPLVALHTAAEYSEREVLPGVYFATQKETLCKLVGEGRRPLLLVSGYSGWAGGQLEGELAAGAWLTAEARSELIFFDDDGDQLWRKVAGEIGRHILFGKSPPKHDLDDPTVN